MKKKTLAFFFLTFLTIWLRAQTNNYTVFYIPYNPNAYTIGTLLPGIDDTWSNKIPIGFNFSYFNNTYSNILIGSNGILSFDSSKAGGYCDWHLGNGLAYTNVIMLPYQDIDVSVGGTIRYNTIGVSPNQKFIVSFYNIPMFSSNIFGSACPGDKFTGQVVLNEGINTIDVFIKHKSFCIDWNNGWAILGLIDKNGSKKITPPGRDLSIWATNNEAWEFCPDTNCIGINSDSLDIISGKLFFDNSDTCNYNDTFDVAIGNIRMFLNTSDQISVSKPNGDFFFYVDTGSYSITMDSVDGFWAYCPSTHKYNISFISYSDSSLNNNFATATATINSIPRIETLNSIFQIFPNPASNSVNITIDETMVGSTLLITDITGRKMTTTPLLTSNFTLPTSTFPNGLYFVTISNEEQTATRKLVVQK